MQVMHSSQPIAWSGHYLRHSSQELRVDTAPPPVPPRPPLKASQASPVHSSTSRWQAACDYANLSRPGHRRSPSSPLLQSRSSSAASPSVAASLSSTDSDLRRPLRVETFVAPERLASSQPSSVRSGARSFTEQYPTDAGPASHPVLMRPYLHRPPAEDPDSAPSSRPVSWHADERESEPAEVPRTTQFLSQDRLADRPALRPPLTRQTSQEQLRAKLASLPTFYAAAHHRPRRNNHSRGPLITLPSRQPLPHTRSQSANAPITSGRERTLSEDPRPSLTAEIAAEHARFNGQMVDDVPRRGMRRYESEQAPRQHECQLGRSDSDASTLVPPDARTLSPCETPPRLDSPPTPEGDVFTSWTSGRFVDNSGWTSMENSCQEETARAFSGRETPEGLYPVRGRYIDVTSPDSPPTPRANEPPPPPSRLMTSEPSPPALPPRRRLSSGLVPRQAATLPATQPPSPVRRPSLDGESTMPRSEYARLLRKKQESVLLRSSIRGQSRPSPSPLPTPVTVETAGEPPLLPPRRRGATLAASPPCEVSNPIYDDLAAILGRAAPNKLSSNSSSPGSSRPSSVSSPTSTLPPGYLPNSYISSRRLPRQGYGGDYRQSNSSQSTSSSPAAKEAVRPHRPPRGQHTMSDVSQGSSAGSEHVRTPSKESCESLPERALFVAPGEVETEIRASPESTLLADNDEEVFDAPPDVASGRESACSGAAAAVGEETLKQELVDSCILHIRERSREEEQLLETQAEAIVQRLPDRKLSLALTCPPVSRLETHLRDMVVKDEEEEEEEEEDVSVLRSAPHRQSQRNGRRGSLSSTVDTDTLKKELLRCFQQRLDLKKQDKPEWEDRQRENMELQQRVRAVMDLKCKAQVKRLERLCHDVDCLFKLMCQLAQRLLHTDETLSRLTKMSASDAELDRIRSQRSKLQAQSLEARQIRSKLCSRQLDLMESVEEMFTESEQEDLAQFIRGLWTISLHRHLIESGIRADEAKVNMLRESLDLADSDVD